MGETSRSEIHLDGKPGKQFAAALELIDSSITSARAGAKATILDIAEKHLTPENKVSALQITNWGVKAGLLDQLAMQSEKIREKPEVVKKLGDECRKILSAEKSGVKGTNNSFFAAKEAALKTLFSVEKDRATPDIINALEGKYDRFDDSVAIELAAAVEDSSLIEPRLKEMLTYDHRVPRIQFNATLALSLRGDSSMYKNLFYYFLYGDYSESRAVEESFDKISFENSDKLWPSFIEVLGAKNTDDFYHGEEKVDLLINKLGKLPEDLKPRLAEKLSILINSEDRKSVSLARHLRSELQVYS